MALLAATLYDPAALATASTASALAMTALDTTNLRLTFTVPANGAVLVRIRVPTKQAAGASQLFLGCLEGATLRGRQVPIAGKVAGATVGVAYEACYVVAGLTPGASLTWDAAYGVEFGVAGNTIAWGGPNDTTAANATGGATFEIWEATNLLAAKVYDPAAIVQKSQASQLAMTALDTTNLRLTFTVPTSGRVILKIRCAGTGGTTPGHIQLAALEGATIRGRATPVSTITDNVAMAATTFVVSELVAPVTGLTAGASLTWDAAYAVEVVAAAMNLSYGGPNDATASNAAGGLTFEIWAA